jgi:hypothetical protein
MIMNYLGFFEKYLDNKVSYLSRAKAKWFENTQAFDPYGRG